jgi:hypothetical protein
MSEYLSLGQQIDGWTDSEIDKYQQIDWLDAVLFF